MFSEQQIQYMLMKEAESFNLVEQELTQEMNHWKKEANDKPAIQRGNLAKSQMLEQKLRAAVDSASSASAGGDTLLQKRIEDKSKKSKYSLMKVRNTEFM